MFKKEGENTANARVKHNTPARDCVPANSVLLNSR